MANKIVCAERAVGHDIERTNEEPVSISTYIDSISDDRDREWLNLKFGGRSCEEIGTEYGVSKSRVEYGVMRHLRNRPLLMEDKYLQLFSEYSFDLQSFVAITEQSPAAFYYLCTVSRAGVQSLKDLQNNKEYSVSIRLRACNYSGFSSLPEKPRMSYQKGKDKSIYKAKDKRVYKRLLTRINKEFNLKFYLGDIAISDEEYQELLEYTRVHINHITASSSALSDAPLLALALVQIGIRRYDGSFWPNASEELGIQLTPQTHQRFLGETFIKTIKVHNKYVLSSTERVNSILFHTFVSNYYSNGLFELLFQYFTHDLERDINRNDKEQMHALMDTLAKKAELNEESSAQFTDQFTGYGSRAYKLRHHTLDAISANPIHSRTRLRRIIRLIDSAFWRETVPVNPTSRLTILFKKWVTDSPSFKKEYKLYKSGEIINRGKKHFSAPYLFANIKNWYFEMKLPSQIVRDENQNNLSWNIKTLTHGKTRQVEARQVITGVKTEECVIKLEERDLLGDIECNLQSGDLTIRHFRIPASDVRFFDMDGDFSQRLFKASMCAYTRVGDVIRSSALIDSQVSGQIARWDFELENGDIIILPNRSSMIVGEYYSDGFVPRGLIQNAIFAEKKYVHIPVYSKIPDLLLTIPKSKINGSIVEINGVRHGLGACKTIEFDIRDSKGEQAFLVALSQFNECMPDSRNTILLDVPGSNYVKPYDFIWVPGFSAVFEGAPYVFDDRGTVIIPNHLKVKPSEPGINRVAGENTFKFELGSYPEYIEVEVGENKLPLRLTVPLFRWSTNKHEWAREPMGDIWHTEFPATIYAQSPSLKIKLSIDVDYSEDNDDDSDLHSVIGEKSEDGTYKFDLTRFKSWITRDKVSHKVHLSVGSKEYEFATIYARSFANTCELSADYDNKLLICKCDIIGRAKYFVDITHVRSGVKIAKKQQLVDGFANFSCALENGKYHLELYEADEDDSGFDEIDYLPVHVMEETLINKDDFSGKHLHVLNFRRSMNTSIYTSLFADYWVMDIQRKMKDIYRGRLINNELGGNTQTSYDVEIRFHDMKNLRFFHLSFWDGYEECYLDYMYDCNEKTLVTEEQEGLPPSEKYRRYKMLFDTDCVYFGILTDEIPAPQKRVTTASLFESTWC